MLVPIKYLLVLEVLGLITEGWTTERYDCTTAHEKETFPDVDYALYGYNILRGYPNAHGSDPGLTYPIFSAIYANSSKHPMTKQTADCRYHVPQGYILAPDVACITSFSSDIVENSNDLQKSLSVSAEVSGGGWGASFSASAEYKKKDHETSSSESVFIISAAKCHYYFAKIHKYNPPPLTNEFIEAAKGITTKETLFSFFDYYGTHFQTYTLFGARFIYEHTMNKTAWASEKTSHINVAAEASYSGTFSLGGKFSMTDDETKQAKNFRSKVTTKTISIGAPPPSDGDTMTWASSIKSNPIPVKLKLESIEKLFTPKFMKGICGFNYCKLNTMIKDKDNKKEYARRCKGQDSEHGGADETFLEDVCSMCVVEDDVDVECGLKVTCEDDIKYIPDIPDTTTNLVLSDNALYTIPDNIFHPLAELKKLDLDSIKLTTLTHNIFATSTKLTWLDLHTNKLTTLPHNVFATLTNLDYLDLSMNQLKTLPPNIFNPLTKLRTLNLRSNNLTQLPDNVFDTLTGLNFLYLQSNPLRCSCLLYKTIVTVTKGKNAYVAGTCDTRWTKLELSTMTPENKSKFCDG